MEQAVLFIGLGFYSLDLIACFGDGPAQGLLVQRLRGNNGGRTLGMGRADLLHGELVANYITHMALAHAAHHAVDLQNGFCHILMPP
jgi:hypothetical protein